MSSFKNIVYYTGFWYSTHSMIGMTGFEGIGYSKKALDQILWDLRLLSLIFDVIHVPRSHILTFQTPLHYEIVKEYLDTNDFKYFNENKILLASTLPYIDNDSDTERIVDRVKSKNWSSEIDNDFIKKIRSLDAVDIDSKREASQNVDIFQEYINLLKVKHKKVADILNEIKKRSFYKQTPFLHELFIEEIAKSPKIDEITKKRIWQATNSYYISTGGHDLAEDRRISLNERIEDPIASHDNLGLQRSLYSPKFIQSLIEEELGDKYIMKFLRADVKDIMKFRNLPSWKNFLDDIFQMFDTITLLEKFKPETFGQYSNQGKIQAYKKYLLQEDSSEIANVIADLLVVAGNAQSEVTGGIVGAGKDIIAKKLIKGYTERKVSQRMKFYKVFWKEFKAELDKIK